MEYFVDPVPAVHGLALADEIGATANRRARDKGVSGLEMCRGGVFDIGDINQVSPLADAAQLTTACALQKSWNQGAIPRPPNQMGP